MPSLFRKLAPNGTLSPFWYAAYDYVGPDGRVHRVKKSTKAKKKGDAMTSALAWEKTARQGSKGLLTQETARKTISDLVEAFTGEKVRTVTIQQQFEDWLQNKGASLAKQSKVRYGIVVRDFLASLGTRAELAIQHLRRDDVVKFRDAEHLEGKSAGTCNLNVKIIGSVIRDACKQGLIEHNPAATVDRVDGDRVEREPFTQEEVEKLLDAAPDNEWRGLIYLGMYTGGRIGDLSHLRWENVDLNAGVICFKPEKTKKKGKELRIPMHQALQSFLLTLPSSDDPQSWLFPKMGKKKTGGEHGLSKTFAGIMTAAKVDSMPVQTDLHAKMGGKNGKKDGKEQGKTRQISRRSFHSLRHTAISMMANAGIPEEVRRKVTGHASGEIHARYTHHDAGILRKAVDSLPNVTAKPA